MQFNKIKLNDIADINMGQSPSGSSYNNKGKGIPFLQGNKTFGFLYPTIDTWTTEPKKIGKKNTVLMSVRAPVGDLNIANKDICIGRGLCSIEMKDGNNQYLYYLLKNSIKKIKMKSTGTVFDSINRKELENIEILNFDKSQQKKISKVLFDIDKKIELNIQTNDNLQKIARNQFYELFANKKVNAKFKDLVNIKKKAIKASNKNTNLGYYPIDMLPMNYLVTQNCKSNEEANSSLIEFSKYDILLGSMRVYFHRVCLAADDGITRNTTFVFEPKQKELLYYALLLIDRDEFIDYANKTSKGSTMPYAVWEALSEYEIYLPENNEISDFSNLMYPLFEKIILNEKENRILEQLRDTLLPKLMNGEIDLDKIEI